MLGMPPCDHDYGHVGLREQIRAMSFARKEDGVGACLPHAPPVIGGLRVVKGHRATFFSASRACLRASKTTSTFRATESLSRPREHPVRDYEEPNAPARASGDG